MTKGITFLLGCAMFAGAFMVIGSFPMSDTDDRLVQVEKQAQAAVRMAKLNAEAGLILADEIRKMQDELETLRAKPSETAKSEPIGPLTFGLAKVLDWCADRIAQRIVDDVFNTPLVLDNSPFADAVMTMPDANDFLGNAIDITSEQ